MINYNWYCMKIITLWNAWKLIIWNKLNSILYVGHARLMFRTEVLVADAVTAIILMESSMLGYSILEGLSPLHTVFPNNPKAEYEEKGKFL